MAEALAQVRKDIGANAVILHTRSYKRGGVLGFGARTVVEITAADGQDLGKYRRQMTARERGQLRKRETNANTSSRKPRQVQHAQPQQPETAGELIRKTYAAARAQMQQENTQTSGNTSEQLLSDLVRNPASAPAPAPVPTRQAAPASDAESQRLAQEMRAVKRMVAKMMQQQTQRSTQNATQDDAKPADLPDKLFDQYMALLEQEVAEELAGEIMQQVRTSVDETELDDDAACKKAVLDAIANLLPQHDDPMLKAPTDRRPRTIALVGPTGVGKTTTVAKLAATFKLRQKKKVGLITLDTYRIAAVDQLRTYANIIGVPLKVVTSPDELTQAVKNFGGCDVVLIDTAGRSQRDDPKLEELARVLAAADPHEVHLVLSSTCSQAVLMDTVERFSKIHTDRIIFTKLDEAVTFGVVLNVMRKVRKKLSYITTGQEVPHQIEPGRADRLAALVLGEGAVST